MVEKIYILDFVIFIFCLLFLSSVQYIVIIIIIRDYTCEKMVIDENFSLPVFTYGRT